MMGGLEDHMNRRVKYPMRGKIGTPPIIRTQQQKWISYGNIAVLIFFVLAIISLIAFWF